MEDSSPQEIVAFMLKQFKPERYVYLTVSIASFLFLIVCVILFLIKNDLTEKNLGYVAGMLGSGGTIAYTSSQLLRMWNDCMKLIADNSKKRDL